MAGRDSPSALFTSRFFGAIEAYAVVDRIAHFGAGTDRGIGHIAHVFRDGMMTVGDSSTAYAGVANFQRVDEPIAGHDSIRRRPI